MKTIFEVKIYANDSENINILTMLANHNEGKCNISLNVFRYYLLAKNAMYPVVFKYNAIIEDNTLHMLDGEKKILSITRIVIPQESEKINNND